MNQTPAAVDNVGNVTGHIDARGEDEWLGSVPNDNRRIVLV